MSFTEEFEVVPKRPCGFIQMLYVYLNSVFEWAASMINPRRLSYFAQKPQSEVELETVLLWRPRPLDLEKLTLKEILSALKSEFCDGERKAFETMISNIKAYSQLAAAVEEIRSQKVSRKDHSHILEQIYGAVLQVSITVGQTKEEDTLDESDGLPDWTLIGFQGSDPLSDFRGGGLLSLHQLAFFVENFREQVRSINVRANHPTKGYGLAITGINITVMLAKALKSGAMKKYFYSRALSVEQFHRAYAEAFIYFDALWTAENPRDIMQFSEIFAKFREQFLVFMKSGQSLHFEK